MEMLTENKGYLESRKNNLNLIIIFMSYHHEIGLLGIMKIAEMFQKNNFDVIVLRDLKRMWYHEGIPSLGNSIYELTHALTEKTKNYHKIITLGSSMGGYGAILLGNLINADYSIGFSPNSFIDKKNRKKYGDKNSFEDKNKVCETTVTPQYLDLKNYFEKNCKDSKTNCLLFCGALNEMDMVHSTRIMGLNNVHLFTRITSHHGLDEGLIEFNMLEKLVIKIRDNSSLQEIIRFLTEEGGLDYTPKNFKNKFLIPHSAQIRLSLTLKNMLRFLNIRLW